MAKSERAYVNASVLSSASDGHYVVYCWHCGAFLRYAKLPDGVTSERQLLRYPEFCDRECGKAADQAKRRRDREETYR